MNPYLEQPDVWQDFHQRFITHLSEALAAIVRPEYLVKIEEQLYIHELPQDQWRLLGRGDVTVAEGQLDFAEQTSSTTTVAPAYGELPDAIDFERMSYLEIRDRNQRQLVTVIELLSPSNKNEGTDREQYLRKRRRAIRTDAHLVELDLLRGGPRLPIDVMPDCDYCVFVSRSQERPRVGIWPIGLREPLPTIPIPLLEKDADAQIDLQATLDRVYDAAGYEDYMYESEPVPPLEGSDAEWAKELIRPP